MGKSEENWTKFSLDKIEDNYLVWPIEVMVKVIFGKYLKGEKLIKFFTGIETGIETKKLMDFNLDFLVVFYTKS